MMVSALLSTSALPEKDVVKTCHSGSLQRTAEFDVNVYGSLFRQPGYLQICVCVHGNTHTYSYTHIYEPRGM